MNTTKFSKEHNKILNEHNNKILKRVQKLNSQKNTTKCSNEHN